VPVNFIKYRILLYLYVTQAHAELEGTPLEEMLGWFGLTEEECALYWRMDDRFQQHVHGEGRRYVYPERYRKTDMSLAFFRQALHDRQVQIADRDVQITAHKNEIVELKKVIRAKEEGLHKLSQDYQTIANSTFWRMTGPARKLRKMDSLDFFPLVLTVVLGLILGCIKIPGINFSLGSSGGILVAGLIVGHFGHLGGIDLRVNKSALNFFRELGLMLFLIGAGVPGGVNFVRCVKVSYFIYGAIMTLIPMILGYLLGRYVFKLSIFNNLGSITGGMTSTPALGTLIHTAGTDEVSGAYAATYPIALIAVVLVSQFLIILF
jgi:AspT/YidE/YbjL antiporter-like protein